MFTTLLAPFQHVFMQQAFLAAVLVGAVGAVLSCFLVLRGWSLMGDAISHAVLPGIVLAYIAGLPLAAGAFVSGLFCALATGWIKNHSRIKEDTVMGVVFTGMFAGGLVLFSMIKPPDVHLDHILFGHLLGITTGQLVQMAVLAAVVIAVVLARRRDLLLVSFDPIHARALGWSEMGLHYLLLTLLALAIVASIQAVGLVLVIAMLITPGATAQLLARRLDAMLATAVAVAVVSSLGGVYVSFHIDGSPAACIVLVQTLVFIAALLWAPGRGLLRHPPTTPVVGATQSAEPRRG